MSYSAFHFVEGSWAGGKTHLLAWTGDQWVVPCETIHQPYRAPRYRKPLCKLCERLTSQIHPYPARRQ